MEDLKKLTMLLQSRGFVFADHIFPPKRFDIFLPCLGDAQKVYMCSYFSLNAKYGYVQIFLKRKKQYC